MQSESSCVLIISQFSTIYEPVWDCGGVRVSLDGSFADWTLNY